MYELIYEGDNFLVIACRYSYGICAKSSKPIFYSSDLDLIISFCMNLDSGLISEDDVRLLNLST